MKAQKKTQALGSQRGPLLAPRTITLLLSLSILLCVTIPLFSVSLAMAAPASPVINGDGTYSLKLSDYANQWVSAVSGGVKYWSLDVVYCASPVDPTVEHMVIYAPDAYMQQLADGKVVVDRTKSLTSTSGMTYNAATAPIIYTNNSGGYSACTTQAVTIDYIKQGYVQVSIGTRGKATKDANGKYIGQFPTIIVDLKAGIRFLKANSRIVPGCTDYIAARGYSSGGAVVAMLGASGNSAIFKPYLTAIGAAKAGDDIFIALSSAPITNLDSADGAFEWFQHANTKYFLFNAMAFDRLGNPILNFPVGPANLHTLGDNVLGGAHEDELSDLLYHWYVGYVQKLGFNLGDNGRSGTYYTGLAKMYSRALTVFIARYDELRTSTLPATADGYLAYLNQMKNGAQWFSWDADTRTATIIDFDKMMVNFVARGKMCPSCDSYNYRSNENVAFINPDGTTYHFSATVRDMLKVLIDNKDSYGWTAEQLTYLNLLYGDYVADITNESTAMLQVMSPINYIVNCDKRGNKFSDSDVAPYWRFRVGSNDGDHGVPAAWLTANGLWKHTHAQVDIGISWNMPHSLAELSNQDLYNYIDGIMQRAVHVKDHEKGHPQCCGCVASYRR